MTTTPDFAGDDGLVILDGSMGQELINSGAVDGTSRWATEGLLENPQAVVDLHQAYISSGVDIITTNSYSVSRDRFEINGVGDRLEELLSLAGELAVQARGPERSARQDRSVHSLRCKAAIAETWLAHTRSISLCTTRLQITSVPTSSCSSQRP